MEKIQANAGDEETSRRKRKWKRARRGNADNHANFYIMGLGYYKSGSSIRTANSNLSAPLCGRRGWLAEFFKTFNGTLPVLKINLQPENYFSGGAFYAERTHFNLTLLSEKRWGKSKWRELDTHKSSKCPQLHSNLDYKCAFLVMIKQKVSLDCK